MHMVLTSLGTVKPWECLQFRLKKKKRHLTKTYTFVKKWTSLLRTHILYMSRFGFIFLFGMFGGRNISQSSWFLDGNTAGFAAAVSHSWYVTITTLPITADVVPMLPVWCYAASAVQWTQDQPLGVTSFSEGHSSCCSQTKGSCFLRHFLPARHSHP